MWNPTYLLPSISVVVTYTNIFGEKLYSVNYISYQLTSLTTNLKPIWISTNLLHILLQSTLKPASLPDFIEQVFIETCFVSGIILETGDINGGQTDKVFAFMKLTTRGEAYISEKILQINIKL